MGLNHQLRSVAPVPQFFNSKSRFTVDEWHQMNAFFEFLFKFWFEQALVALLLLSSSFLHQLLKSLPFLNSYFYSVPMSPLKEKAGKSSQQSPPREPWTGNLSRWTRAKLWVKGGSSHEEIARLGDDGWKKWALVPSLNFPCTHLQWLTHPSKLLSPLPDTLYYLSVTLSCTFTLNVTLPAWLSLSPLPHLSFLNEGEGTEHSHLTDWFHPLPPPSPQLPHHAAGTCPLSHPPGASVPSLSQSPSHQVALNPSSQKVV